MQNIAIISHSDTTSGGTGRIAGGLVRLLNALPNYGAHHWVARLDFNADWNTYKLHGGQCLSLLQGACAITSQAIGLPDFFTPELLIHLKRKPVEYDLYHFHGIPSTFSPLALKWLAKRKPIIWTMHDCSPFTGGCTVPMDCQAFYTRCKNCPQLNKWPLRTRIDFTGVMQTYKRKLLSEWPIVPIAPSKWLANEAIKAVDFKIKPVIIPNFVDISVYKPLEKSVIREILGLPKDRFIVLLSATNLSDEHKGNKFAVEALKQITPRPYIVAIGSLAQNYQSFFDGLDVHATGYICNDQLLAQYYAAANVFLFPTLADSFGCVAIETMACGTPSIAFATGGVPEIIDHDRTGWLVAQKDVRGLVEGLNIVMSQPDRLSAWGSAGSKKAELEYAPNIFLKRHIDLYEQVMAW